MYLNLFKLLKLTFSPYFYCEFLLRQFIVKQINRSLINFFITRNYFLNNLMLNMINNLRK